jgi:hypothetical protein
LIGTCVHRGGGTDHGVDGTGDLRSPNRTEAFVQPARQTRAQKRRIRRVFELQ